MLNKLLTITIIIIITLLTAGVYYVIHLGVVYEECRVVQHRNDCK